MGKDEEQAIKLEVVCHDCGDFLCFEIEGGRLTVFHDCKYGRASKAIHDTVKAQAKTAESQVAALQEQVKALTNALFVSRAAISRYLNEPGVLETVDAALSQVPAQKEQDNG